MTKKSRELQWLGQSADDLKHPIYDLTLFDELELIKCQLMQIRKTTIKENAIRMPYKTKDSNGIMVQHYPSDHMSDPTGKYYAQHAMDCLKSLYTGEFKQYVNSHYMFCLPYRQFNKGVSDHFIVNDFYELLNFYTLRKNNLPVKENIKWICTKDHHNKDPYNPSDYTYPYSENSVSGLVAVGVEDIIKLTSTLLRHLRAQIRSIVEQNVQLVQCHKLREPFNHRPIELSPAILDL